jgi:hypothetical protein
MRLKSDKKNMVKSPHDDAYDLDFLTSSQFSHITHRAILRERESISENIHVVAILSSLSSVWNNKMRFHCSGFSFSSSALIAVRLPQFQINIQPEKKIGVS